MFKYFYVIYVLCYIIYVLFPLLLSFALPICIVYCWFIVLKYFLRCHVFHLVI